MYGIEKMKDNHKHSRYLLVILLGMFLLAASYHLGHSNGYGSCHQQEMSK